MKNRIYVNIMFKPKIWGLYFTSLFAVLGGFVLSLMLLSFLTEMILSFLINICLFGVLFAYCWHRDNRDEIEYSAKRSGAIKRRVSSFTVSEQRARVTG